MPTKKKPAFHSKKKASLASKSEEQTPEPKADRPVMQVVQVPEETPVSPEPVGVSTSSEAPVGSASPLPATTETSSTVEPVQSGMATAGEEAPVAEKKEPAEKAEITASPVVSPQPGPTPTTATPAGPVSTPSETFLEELPPVKSSKGGLIILLVILLLVVCAGVGGYMYYKGVVKLPTSISSLLNMKKTPAIQNTVTPPRVVTPTPTPVAVDKSKYTIEVLNGSGVPGEAAKVKNALTAIGYTVSSTGNAATTDFTQTEISAKVSVNSAFITALRGDVSKLYSVSSNLVALPAQSSVDIIVTVGSQAAE